MIYPEQYPDVAPHLELSAPPNAPKEDHLDIHADKGRLLASLEPIIDENLGMAMIFTVISSLKDAAEQLIAERQGSARADKEAEAAMAEEEENRKFQGRAVTRESFLEWRTNFRFELEQEEERKVQEREAEDKRKRIKPEERLSGRQLWERGLVGKVDEDDEELADDIANLNVDN